MPPRWPARPTRGVPFWATVADLDYGIETLTRYEIPKAKARYDVELERAAIHLCHGRADSKCIRALADARRELAALQLLLRELQELRDLEFEP